MIRTILVLVRLTISPKTLAVLILFAKTLMVGTNLGRIPEKHINLMTPHGIEVLPRHLLNLVNFPYLGMDMLQEKLQHLAHLTP